MASPWRLSGALCLGKASKLVGFGRITTTLPSTLLLLTPPILARVIQKASESSKVSSRYHEMLKTLATQDFYLELSRVPCFKPLQPRQLNLLAELFSFEARC